MTELLGEPDTLTEFEKEIVHLACCRYREGNRIIAFCGTDVTDDPRVDDEPADKACAMCVEVSRGSDHDHCPMTGELCPPSWDWA